MKPLIYYDFKSINETEVAIDKIKLKAILDEVYGAGFADGQAQIYKPITRDVEYINQCKLNPAYGSITSKKPIGGEITNISTTTNILNNEEAV